MNLPPNPGVDAGPATRQPPRFVPTLTEVWTGPAHVEPSPDVADTHSDRPSVSSSLQSSPAPDVAGRPSEVAAVAPSAHAAPPFAIDPQLAQHITEQVLARVWAEIPVWLAQSLSPRIEAAVQSALPELETRLRIEIDALVRQQLTPDAMQPARNDGSASL